MKHLPPLFCFLLLLGPLRAAEPTTLDRVLQETNWQTGGLEAVNPKDEAPLIVRIEFEKEGLWRKQVDDYGLRPKPETKDPKTSWLYGKGWGSSHNSGSGSGVARPKNFTKEGFEVEFSLKWKDTPQGDGEFKETIPCRWVSEQLFDRGGFLIKVTIEKAADNIRATGAH